MNGKGKIAIVVLAVVIVLAAWFLTIQHDVDVTVEGQGTVEPSGDIVVGHLGSVEFQLIPADGWSVGDVTVNGKIVGTDGKTLKLSGIAKDQYVHVTFVPLGELYTLTVITDEGGMVTPEGVTSHVVGEKVMVTITPDSNKVIASIILDGEPVEVINVLDIIMDSDHVLEVTFRDATLDDPVVSIDVDVDVRVILPEKTLGSDATYDFGIVHPVGDVIVPYGGSLIVVIDLNPGYEVEYSIIDGTDYGHNSTFALDDITYSFDIDIGIVKLVEADHVVTLTAGKGGEITPEGKVGVSTGDDLTFKVKAYNGYKVSEASLTNRVDSE